MSQSSVARFGREEHDSPQRIRHGDKVQATLVRIDPIFGPFGKNESRCVLQKAVNILPAFRLESLARDLEERSTQVDNVHCVKVADRKVLVHLFHGPSRRAADVDPNELLGRVSLALFSQVRSRKPKHRRATAQEFFAGLVVNLIKSENVSDARKVAMNELTEACPS